MCYLIYRNVVSRQERVQSILEDTCGYSCSDVPSVRVLRLAHSGDAKE